MSVHKKLKPRVIPFVELKARDARQAGAADDEDHGVVKPNDEWQVANDAMANGRQKMFPFFQVH